MNIKKSRGLSLVLIMTLLILTIITGLFIFKNRNVVTESTKTTKNVDANNKKYVLKETTIKILDVIAVEKYTTLNTGGRSIPYKYWDKKKYVYHYNCFGAMCVQEDYECSPLIGFIDNVSSEFSLALKTSKLLEYYDEDQVDLWGSGFALTLSDDRKVFLSDTPIGRAAFCVMGENCTLSRVGLDRQPFTSMGYELKENLTFYDGEYLLNTLRAANERDFSEYENCKTIISDNEISRPLYTH